MKKIIYLLLCFTVSSQCYAALMQTTVTAQVEYWDPYSNNYLADSAFDVNDVVSFSFIYDDESWVRTWHYYQAGTRYKTDVMDYRVFNLDFKTDAVFTFSDNISAFFSQATTDNDPDGLWRGHSVVDYSAAYDTFGFAYDNANTRLSGWIDGYGRESLVLHVLNDSQNDSAVVYLWKASFETAVYEPGQVPLPASIILFISGISGLIALAGLRRR